MDFRCFDILELYSADAECFLNNPLINSNLQPDKPVFSFVIYDIANCLLINVLSLVQTGNVMRSLRERHRRDAIHEP